MIRKFLANFIAVEKWPIGAVTVPHVQAHRGYWKADSLKENSLEAFRAAKRNKIAMCECDLRLSRDGVPVVYHDATLKRLEGKDLNVADLTAKELKIEGNIPSLREILLDPDCPKLWNLELKSDKILNDSLERKVSEEIKLQAAERRILFSSFNPFSLMRAGLNLPQVPRALLVTDHEDKNNNWLLKNMVLSPLFSFHLLHLDQSLVSQEGIRHWQKRRIPIAVWTVNGREKIQQFLDFGAVSVITDTP